MRTRFYYGLWIALLPIVALMSGAARADGTPERKPTARDSAPVPKGSRILGIALGEAEDKDFGKAFAAAKSAGLQATTLSLNWTDIEANPGTLKNGLLSIANTFYSSTKTKLDLVLRPINTNRKEVPADLKETPFDAPEMQARFRKLLDYVFSQIPDLDLHSLAIGNEVDAYLGTDDRLWKQYVAFYKAASAYARTKRRNLKVGVVAQFSGLAESAVERFKALKATSDLIFVTYYPLDSAFHVKAPAIVHTDFARLTKLYANRPLNVIEIGYPTGAACGSSEEKQAEFVRNVFQMWDRYAAQIPTLHFEWLTDLAPAAVEGFGKYYGVSTEGFKGFLATLGLRTYPGSGRDKLGFLALKEEAKARGWQQAQ